MFLIGGVNLTSNNSDRPPGHLFFLYYHLQMVDHEVKRKFYLI